MIRAISVVAVAVCCSAVDVFTPENKTLEYLSAVSPYNAFCPLRCPDLVAVPESEEDLARYLQRLQEESPRMPLTIRGGGHSYSCQSTSSTGVVIDMKRFRQLKVKRTLEGRHEAELGAGLRFGEVSPVMEKHGWSMPHGQCKTVGVAGWMLNRGSHPLLQNYQNSYGPEGFLREIRAVTVLGSRLRIRRDKIEVISRSRFEDGADLERKIRLLPRPSDANPDGYLLWFRWYGANFLIATQFTVEIREAKPPLVVRIGYNISRLPDLIPKLYNAMIGPDEEVKCLVWPHLHMKSKKIGAPSAYPSLLDDPERLYLQCVHWSPLADAASIVDQVGHMLGEVPDMSMADTLAFDRMSSHEGFGWYPAFFEAFVPNTSHVAEMVELVANGLNESDCRINAGMGLHARPGWREHPFGFNHEDHGLTKEEVNNGAWIGYDVWFGDDQDRKEECIASARKFMARFGEEAERRGFYRRPIDVHLPDCSVEEDGPSKWTDKSWQSLYYQRESYGRLLMVKKMWDPNDQISFFLALVGRHAIHKRALDNSPSAQMRIAKKLASLSTIKSFRLAATCTSYAPRTRAVAMSTARTSRVVQRSLPPHTSATNDGPLSHHWTGGISAISWLGRTPSLQPLEALRLRVLCGR